MTPTRQRIAKEAVELARLCDDTEKKRLLYVTERAIRLTAEECARLAKREFQECPKCSKQPGALMHELCGLSFDHACVIRQAFGLGEEE